ncbi:MAG TPA: hypothetical protein VGR35_01005 [Tepidisphaeraceae bacterium]|nr:hypothetical protein [Tepidisphaeraceae bacterium]
MADPYANSDGIERVKGPDGRDLYLLEYEVTEDSLEETRIGLTPEVEAQYEELHELTMTRPAEAVPRLESLVEKYPQIPVLKNWLSVAYQQTGREAESDAMGERLWREHPDYLFARISQAQVHLRRGELEKVPTVFGDKLDLKLMYPHRNVFHISEVVAMYNVLAEWHCRKGEPDKAMIYLDQLEELAPEHPVTERLELMLMPEILTEAIKQLASRPRRVTRRKRGTATRKKKRKGSA